MAAYDISRFRHYGRITPSMAERLAGDRMYELTIYMLALYYYDNRGVSDKGVIPEGLLPIVNTLHYTPERSDAL